jgi:hypothetical protein
MAIMSRSRAYALAALWTLAASLPFMAVPGWSATPSVDGTWSALDASAPAPGARREYAAVYDYVNQRYLVFAGFYGDLQGTYQLLNEVWTLSLGVTPTWGHLDIPGPTPGERHSPQWGYDPARNRLLVFGGYGRHYPGDPYAYLNDVWQLSLDGTPAWTELTPSGTAPSGRLAGVAVYDVLRQRFVGFGGTIGMPVDTWELDLSGEPAWSTVPTAGASPNGGYGMTSIYDLVRDRMVVFGGSTGGGYYGVHNDTWVLNLHSDTPSWHQLSPSGTLPTARRTMASIYDPLRDRMIVFAGWDGTENGTASFLNDTWALSLTGSPEWTQLLPEGTTPTGRDAMAAAYDPLGDRMVVFGGWSGLTMLGDTQFLSWGGIGQAANVSASSQADPDVAHVQWDVQNATGSYVGVYRRQSGTPWSSIATAQSNASGTVAFDDPTVTPGEQYAYMLAVSSELGAELGGEAWVDVPTGATVSPTPLTFALHRVRPNPVVGRFVASFALPGAAPARLELLDVAGRRVFSRAVGSLGPGSHTLEMGARAFAPGMYFLRLVQSGRSASTRVVVGAQ